MKDSYGLSILMALAIPVMTASVWAGEAADAGGGSGCMMQQPEPKTTGCGPHDAVETKDETEATSPCGMNEMAASGTKQAATRSAMMDGRAGGWPRRHDDRALGAKKSAQAGESGTLKHGGCS